ncbi:AraC family transcriptional regulator [Biformimicrobium ophioploci]|uniref:AraC family transcriptional regulator n=1 Tax=Biformimicrobium ophioploci TaxID=3036711 RepID=A0ABQ6LZ32_9GAMM|nr:AraC family transcriptional regulator [Microbulbifer sp. NKW57]
MASVHQSLAVLELIPGTHAWAKDREGRFVFGSRLFFERFGFASMEALLGKTDYDLAPAEMVQSYRVDDELVLGGGVITDRLELILSGPETVGWFLTSKWPIYDPQGQVIGTFGISRSIDESETSALSYQDLRVPINYIGEHFASNISVAAIASACNISVSALERRFRKHLKKTPRQYINEVRLEHARSLLLKTRKSVGTIALETGFSDHSHFTRAFTKYFGLSPRDARRGGSAE